MSQLKPQNSYINIGRANELLGRWGKILDAEGSKNVKPIEDAHTRLNTAILLENQHKWCMENNLASDGGVFGASLQGSPGQGGKFSNDFYASGDARLPKVLIPMIRRTFPELITNEIVGVQPMSGPVGLAFALRYRYEADALGDFTIDGKSATNPATPGHRSRTDGQEVGWNYLNSGFTGISSAALSGNADFEFTAEDDGVAEILKNFELTSNIPQMTIQFEKTAVEAGTRRLAARWSVELEQDIKNMNGIDIDSEMTNTMSYEIQAEIDREMIMRMVQVALNAGKGPGYSIWHAASADARWSAERGRDLYNKVLVESNRVAVRNRRGPANFLVATPTVCAIFQNLPEFQFNPVQSNVNTHSIGIARVGNLAGQFNVYRDTRTEAQFQVGTRGTRLEYVLLGYKGPEFYDTGIVYCPYIPVMVQRTIAPNDFAPRVGLMTRYGVIDHLFGADLYYHVIIVKGLGEAFTPGEVSVYL